MKQGDIELTGSVSRGPQEPSPDFRALDSPIEGLRLVPVTLLSSVPLLRRSNSWEHFCS